MATLRQSPVDPAGGAITPPATPTSSGGTLTGLDLEHVVFWGGGAAALLIITDHWPRAGLALTGLIVAGVMLRFASGITTWIQGLTATSTTVAGGASKGSNSSGTGPVSRVVALPGNAFLRDAIRGA